MSYLQSISRFGLSALAVGLSAAFLGMLVGPVSVHAGRAHRRRPGTAASHRTRR
jgi:hypothetical protein